MWRWAALVNDFSLRVDYARLRAVETVLDPEAASLVAGFAFFTVAVSFDLRAMGFGLARLGDFAGFGTANAVAFAKSWCITSISSACAART